MDETSRPTDDAELAFCQWLGFWTQFFVLGILAGIGAFSASTDAQSGNYACGVMLSLGAIALAFLRLKNRFDGGSSSWGAFLLVDDKRNLALVIPLFAVIGLAGLFIAHSWESGNLHVAGLGLFFVSGVIVFLDIKRVFDRIDSRAP